MAFNTFAQGNFTKSTTTLSIVIYKKDYVGLVKTLLISGDVVVQKGTTIQTLKSAIFDIKSSQLRFNIVDTNSDIFNSLLLTETGDFKVEILEGSNILYEGWILPSSIEKNNYLSSPSLTIVASCGINLLKSIPFDLSGYYTISDLLRALIMKTGTELTTLVYLNDFKDVASSSPDPRLIRIKADYIVPGRAYRKTYFDILSEISKRFGLTVFQDSGFGVSGNDATWYAINRSVLRVTDTLTEAYYINLSSGSVDVEEYSQTTTITTSHIAAEHFKGQLQPSRFLGVYFDWLMDSPPVENSEFEAWNGTKTLADSWTLDSGNVTKETSEFESEKAAIRSVDNAEISQTLTFTKPPNEPLTLIAMSEVKYMDPLGATGVLSFQWFRLIFKSPFGEFADTYMNEFGETTTDPSSFDSWIRVGGTYSAPQAGTIESFTNDFILDPSSPVYDKYAVVNLEVHFRRDCFEAPGLVNAVFEWVQFTSVLILLSEELLEKRKSFPVSWLSFYDVSQIGSEIEYSFYVSSVNKYANRGILEIFNGTNWIYSDDWSGSTDKQTLDFVWTEWMFKQINLPLLYYKMKVILKYKTVGMHYLVLFDSKKFNVIYQLINYTKGFTDIQLLEIASNTVSSPEEKYVLS